MKSPDTIAEAIEAAAGEVAGALSCLGQDLRGDSSLAERSTIPDNLAEMCIRITDAASMIQRAFLDHEQQHSVTDALLKIGRGLHRIADAMEKDR